MISLKGFYHEWKISRHNQRFFMACGVIFLFLTLAGIALPVVPQIPFAIASAFFFSKGSKKIHLAIRHNKIVGKAVCDWEDHKVIRLQTKFFSVLAMVGGMVMGHLSLPGNWVYLPDLIFLFCIVFVLTRKSAPFKLPYWKRLALKHKVKKIL